MRSRCRTWPRQTSEAQFLLSSEPSHLPGITLEPRILHSGPWSDGAWCLVAPEPSLGPPRPPSLRTSPPGRMDDAVADATLQGQASRGIPTTSGCTTSPRCASSLTLLCRPLFEIDRASYAPASSRDLCSCFISESAPMLTWPCFVPESLTRNETQHLSAPDAGGGCGTASSTWPRKKAATKFSALQCGFDPDLPEVAGGPMSGRVGGCGRTKSSSTAGTAAVVSGST